MRDQQNREIWTIETWPANVPLPDAEVFVPYGAFEVGSAPLMPDSQKPFPGTGIFKIKRTKQRFQADGFYLTAKGTYRNRVTKIA